jgi:hemoglobin
MKWRLLARILVLAGAAFAGVWLVGCRASSAEKSNANFFTSGSREADQRASQRMAQSEQLSGSGEGAGEKGVKKAKESGSGTTAPGGDTNKGAIATEKLALFDRLGGVAGVSNIVMDFTARVLDDPRVNWNRQGVTRGGFSLHRGQSETWKPTPQHVALLQKHLIEFLALATGGPAQYTGKQIEPAHANMHISNPEFDATMGDLKASLDKLKAPTRSRRNFWP